MPRVPTSRPVQGKIEFTSSVSPERTLALGQSIGNSLARAVQPVEQFILESRAAINESKRKDSLIEQTSQMNRKLTVAKSESESTDEYLRTADAIVNKAAEDSGDREIALSLKQTGRFAVDSAHVALTAKFNREGRAVARGSFQELVLPEHANAAAAAFNSGNMFEVERVSDEFDKFLRLTDHFSDEEKIILREEFETQRETSAVNQLIEAALADPATSADSLGRASDLLDKNVTTSIDSDDRLMLRKAVNTAANSIATQTNRLIAVAGRAASNEFLVRIHDPDPSKFPTIPEVVGSMMTRIEKDHYIDIIDKHSTGEDTRQGATAVEVNLIARIHDPLNPDPITSANQLVPYLGKGLGTEMFQTLLSDLEKKASPQTKLIERQFSDFLSSAKPRMVTPSFVPNSDPMGMKNYNDFTIAARLLWDRGIAQGKTPDQLLTSDSPDFIGKIIPNYESDTITKNKAAVESLTGPPAQVPETVPARNSKETPAQYLERVGGVTATTPPQTESIETVREDEVERQGEARQGEDQEPSDIDQFLETGRPQLNESEHLQLDNSSSENGANGVFKNGKKREEEEAKRENEFKEQGQ